MRRIKLISECVLCVMTCMMLCACPDSDEIVPVVPDIEDGENGGGSEEKKPSVSLEYYFACNQELLEFITPTLTYTDKEGTHEVVLTDELMTTSEYLYVHKTEDGKTTYSVVERDDNGEVPEPWILDDVKYISSYCANVQLNSLGLENICFVTYQKKSGYNLNPTRVYDLSRSFGCIKGSASFVSNGLHSTSYIGITINYESKTSWIAEEVEPYLDYLCRTTDSEIMIVDENGKISQKR